jgi:hypothetical protein
MTCGTLYPVVSCDGASSAIRLSTPEEATALRDALVAAGRGADVDEIAAIHDAYERVPDVITVHDGRDVICGACGEPSETAGRCAACGYTWPVLS